MSDNIIYLITIPGFFILELLYFRIADNYNIIDKPNHRSSHTSVTIRGGGIIFPLAIITWFIQSGFQYPLFLTGLILISTISFLDDVYTLKSSIRSLFQFIAVGLLLAQIPLNIAWYFYPVIFILIVGTKNAYNFMDGINGITGAYSLITLLSLGYINRYVIPFTSESLIIITCLSLLVFNFFNFRKKAKCFAGDVGSVSIAFIILFLLIQLISNSGNLGYILLLLMYGLDAVTTIFFRVIRRENILEAHRTHFYQFLANEKKWSHLAVATMYSVFQLLINVCILYLKSFTLTPVLIIILLSGAAFIILRFNVEGKSRLILR